MMRRKKLENWKFWCGCDRCNEIVDRNRSWRCVRCRSGCHYFRENQNLRKIRSKLPVQFIEAWAGYCQYYIGKSAEHVVEYDLSMGSENVDMLGGSN